MLKSIQQDFQIWLGFKGLVLASKRI